MLAQHSYSLRTCHIPDGPANTANGFNVKAIACTWWIHLCQFQTDFPRSETGNLGRKTAGKWRWTDMLRACKRMMMSSLLKKGVSQSLQESSSKCEVSRVRSDARCV